MVRDPRPTLHPTLLEHVEIIRKSTIRKISPPEELDQPSLFHRLTKKITEIPFPLTLILFALIFLKLLNFTIQNISPWLEWKIFGNKLFPFLFTLTKNGYLNAFWSNLLLGKNGIITAFLPINIFGARCHP